MHSIKITLHQVEQYRQASQKANPGDSLQKVVAYWWIKINNPLFSIYFIFMMIYFIF